MAENKETIIFEIVVDKQAGEMSIAGLTNGVVSLEKGVKLVNAELDKLNTKTKQTKDVSGLAGATLNEFGRTISDMPYGIQGVSNNLAQLTTLFGGMVQGTNSAKEAFNQLIKTLVGNPILAITIAVQALIAIYTKFDQNQKKTKASVDELNKSLSGAQGTIGKLEAYASVLKDVNASTDEQRLALSKLRKEGYDELTGSVDKFIEAKKRMLIFNIQEEHLTKELTKVYEKRMKLEQEYADQIAVWQEQGSGPVSNERTGAIISTTEQIIERRRKLAESFGLVFQDISKEEEAVMNKMANAAKSLSNQLSDNPFFDKLLGGEKSRQEKLKPFKTEAEGINREVLDEMKKYYQRVFEGTIFDIKPQIKSMQDNAREELKGLKKIDTTIRDEESDREIFLNNKREQAKKATLAAMADLGNNIASLLDADFQKQLDVEQSKTNAINNELKNRLLNENLSKDERKKIQNEIAMNDEKLRLKQEKIEKKRFEMQKAANISRAVIDTYTAATAALSNGGGVPYGIPAMVATIAAGLAQVATIAKQQFVSSQSGVPMSVGVLGEGTSGGATAPEFNVVGQSASNQIAAAVKGQFSQPIKAFVVSKDVSSAQEFDRNVVTAASLG